MAFQVISKEEKPRWLLWVELCTFTNCSTRTGTPRWTWSTVHFVLRTDHHQPPLSLGKSSYLSAKTLGGSECSSNHFAGQLGVSIKTLKMHEPFDPVIPLLDLYLSNHLWQKIIFLNISSLSRTADHGSCGHVKLKTLQFCIYLTTNQ